MHLTSHSIVLVFLHVYIYMFIAVIKEWYRLYSDYRNEAAWNLLIITLSVYIIVVSTEY